MATATKHTAIKDPSNNAVRVEDFDQPYNLRGSDAEYILKLAEYVDGKMRAVSGADPIPWITARLAVLAALNIAKTNTTWSSAIRTWDPATTCAAPSISRAPSMKSLKTSGELDRFCLCGTDTLVRRF